jgi:hypothetical protein
MGELFLTAVLISADGLKPGFNLQQGVFSLRHRFHSG